MGASKYTPEQVQYLISIIPGHSYEEIADLFYRQFEVEMTVSQVNSFIGNRKLNTGHTGRFEKGHVPANKGKKGVGGWEPTQFKKGDIPKNYRPVGSERVNVDGYTEIKVADPRKWSLKHRVIWEQANGPIPKGHVVIFGDGDRLNLDLNNLILISQRQLSVLNTKGLIQNSAELTKVGITVADIYLKIGERRTNNKKAL